MSTTTLISADQWQRCRLLWHDIVGYGAHVNKELCTLIVLHEHGKRHYHTLDHAMACVGVAREYFLDDTEYRLNKLEQMVVEIALLFHDSIYNPSRNDNEELSAEAAAKCCESLGMSPDFISKVKRAILDTKTHLPTEEYGAFVSDADLSILAAVPSVYKEYADGIRQEYSVFYTDDEYLRGRIAFLEKELIKPKFFYLTMNERLNHAARQNMGAELVALREVAKSKGGTT